MEGKLKVLEIEKEKMEQRGREEETGGGELAERMPKNRGGEEWMRELVEKRRAKEERRGEGRGLNGRVNEEWWREEADVKN